jgi:transcriptional regulator with XRE-family HTH domain
MNQETIGQRLKILIKQLDLDVRGFCKRLDVSETSIRNYFSRGNNPNAEFLTKLTSTFEYVNLHWLLTGNGESFLPPPNENNQAITGNQKFFRSPVVATGQGPAYQENNAAPAAADTENLKNKLALAEKEVEHLKAQLATKDALLASKEETLALLRLSFNRPN